MAGIMTSTVPISSMTKNITCEITLTGMKTWNVRLYLGTFLFKVAAWVTGMKGVVKIGNETFGTIR